MSDTGIDFNAPAVLRKGPSLENERVSNAWGGKPYLILEGTLLECINAVMAKPASQLGAVNHRREPMRLERNGRGRDPAVSQR